MAALTHQTWHDGEVVEAVDIARGVRRLGIRTAAAHKAAPGTHVDVKVLIDGHEHERAYSVVEVSPDGHTVYVSVQLAPNSRGGSAYMHSLAVGDPIRVTQPLQNFPLGVGAASYLLVAGGIGITALKAMAGVLKARQAAYRMVYVGRDRSVMAYLDDLIAEHGDVLSVHVDSEGTPLDVDALVESAAQTGGTELYLCGPIRLMDHVRRAWAARGLAPSSLRFETFGNSGAWAPQEFVVKIPRLGVETRVGANQTMLEALEDTGVEMMFDCRKGECGLCQVKVCALEGGMIDHRDVFLSETERDSGTTLCACVSRGVSAGTPRLTDAGSEAGDQAYATAPPAVLTIDVT